MTKKPSVYDKYLHNLEKLAEDAFKNHQIRSSGDGRWTIQAHKDGRWDGIYWTEIVNLDGGGLLVHGDISTCLFKYYSGDKHATSRIRWIARSSIDYLKQKCSIGMDDSSVCRTFDDDVALWEIEGYARDRVNDICYEEGYETPEIKFDGGKIKFELTDDMRSPELEDDEWLKEDKEKAEKIIKQETEKVISKIKEDDEILAWFDAYSRLNSGQHWDLIINDLYEELSDAGVDCSDYIGKVGVVPAPRLFYARAACRKLVELLDKDESSADSQ